jgi:hypothetical protein
MEGVCGEGDGGGDDEGHKLGLRYVAIKLVDWSIRCAEALLNCTVGGQAKGTHVAHAAELF